MIDHKVTHYSNILSIPIILSLFVGYIAPTLKVNNAVLDLLFNVIIIISYYYVTHIKGRVHSVNKTRNFISILILYDIFVILLAPNATLSTYVGYELSRYAGLIILLYPYPVEWDMKIIVMAVLKAMTFYCMSLIIYIAFSGFDRTSLAFSGSDYNVVAAMCLVSLPILSCSMIYGKELRLPKKWFLLCITMMVYLIVLSGSRSALGIVVLNVLAMGYVIRERFNFSKFIIIIIFFSAILYLLMENGIFENSVSRAMEKSIEEDERNLMWLSSIQTFVSGNIFIGYGSHKLSLDLFDRLVEPHNIIIETLLNSGLIGLTFFIVYHIRVIKCASIGAFANNKNRIVFMTITVITCFGSGMVHPIMTSSFVYNYLYALSLFAVSHITLSNND